MSDGRALLAAICANPDEDTPRLAYADWLDEHVGSMPKPKRDSVRARAELIRVQCELAAMSPDEEDADTATRRVELELRAEELLRNGSRRMAWAKPLRPVPDGAKLAPDTLKFVRGFPSFAHGAAIHVLVAGERLFDVSPVSELNCHSVHDDEAEQLLAQSWLTRVRRLRVYPHYEAHAAVTERVFTAPALADLDSLEIECFEFAPPGSPVAARPLARLRRLSLRHGAKRADPLDRLGELLPADARVADLYFHHSVTHDHLKALVAMPQFGTLERFAMDSYGLHVRQLFSAENLRTLTVAPAWRTLRALRTDNFGDRDRSLRAVETEVLADAPPSALRTLAIPIVDAAALAPLTESSLLAGVTTLELPRIESADEAVALLAKSPRTRRLVRLDLDWSDLGPKGVKALADAPFAANLVALHLGGCEIRKAGVELLLDPKAFPRLRRVNLISAVRLKSQRNQLRQRFGTGAQLSA